MSVNLKRTNRVVFNDGIACLCIMTAVLLLVCAFFAAGLNTYIFRTDELFSVSNMGGFDQPYSPIQIVRSVVDFSPDHVPLFFLVGAGWARLVGWSQTALRAFSVLSAVMMIAWLFRLGSDVFDRQTGLLATVLMGTSAYLVLHFHDFRMYSLLLLLGIIHCWLYWRLKTGRTASRACWLYFVASAIALIYTHVFSIILFAGLGIYHVVLARKSESWTRIAAGWGIAAACFLPYLPTLLDAVQQAAENTEVTGSAASAGELISAFAYLLTNGALWLLIPLAFAWAYGIFWLRDRALVRFSLIPLAMLVVILLLNEFVGLIPLSRMRYFIILWFPFLLLLARGVSRLPRMAWFSILCVAVWSVAGFQFYRSPQVLDFIGGMAKTRLYPPLQEYVYHLREKVRPEDFLLGFTREDYLNFDHKHGKSVSDFYTQLHLGIDGAFVRSRAIGPWLDEEMRKLIDGHPYLLFAFEPQNKPDGLDGAIYFMETTYTACEIVLDSESLVVKRYVDPMLDCDRQYEPIAYANGISVVDRRAQYRPESAELRILIGWEVPDEQLYQELSVSFQVLTPDWEKAQAGHLDLYLHQLRKKWNVVDLPIDGVMPGEYRLVVILYNSETGEKVSGVDVSTGESGAILSIFAFAVE